MEKIELIKDFNRIKYTKLAISLFIDALGFATYFVPALGESADLIWGPISGLMTFILFRGVTGLIGGTANALEEMLPFTDLIPGVTLTWFTKYIIMKKQTLADYLKGKKEENDLLEKYSK
jgi:hypothetical protein